MLENHHRGFLLFLLLLYTNQVSATRRGLHQPFFPDDSGTAVSSVSPPANTPTTTTGPFFPFSNPTPTVTTNSPPAAIPSVTIPANISGLLHPKTSASNGFSSEAKKVVILVVISLFSLGTLLSLILLFRRLSSGEFKARSTSVPLFPAGDPGSTATKETVGSSSEALYLGTIVDSKRDECKDAVVENIPYRKLGSPVSFQLQSPDLQPLPPLSRQCGTSEPRRGSTDDDDDDDNQSFYSPRSSSAGNRRHDVAAAQRVLSPATTPSYPSSKSTSPAASRVASPRSETETCGRRDSAGFRLPLPPSPSTLGGRQTLPSPLSSPSDVSIASGSSSESGRRSFSGQTVSITGPPLPPPPPQKGTPWMFPITPPPSRRPNTPSSPLVSPPRDTESAKADSFPETKLQSKLNSTDSDEGSAEQPGEAPRPKLKALHWDKVRACSDRAMVWDQLKSSSFQLNEEMIETLFVCNSVAAAPKKMNRRGILSSPLEENRVLDPKKSQNVAILLRALNVTKEEICEALIEGNTEGLGTELLETLLKMAPTKEEELKLKGYKDDSNSKLGPAERFLKAVLDIPFAFKRVDAMLYIANFDPEIAYLRKSFQTIEAACEELRTSRLFLKLLEAVLKTGNRMNVGTNRGDAHAFKLDTLLKLADVKGTDGRTTLLHFVVQEIIRYEGAHIAKLRSPTEGFVAGENLNRLGLQVVSALSGELSNVKKAASMDSDVLGSCVSKLTRGLEKISDVIRLAGVGEPNAQFVLSMSSFKQNAEQEILRIRAEENAAFSLVKEITVYFHGDAAREEAHPFRIFVIVRDFLDVLDHVCKEVGRMQDRTTVAVGTGCRCPVPVNTTFTHTTPGVQLCRWTDSDDSSSSSSS